MKIPLCILASLCFLGCATAIKDIATPYDRNGGKPETFAYGYVEISHSSDFEIDFSNAATGEKKSYSKSYLVADFFTPPDRSILFSFPIPAGKWRIDLVSTSAVYGTPNTSKKFEDLDITEGKGNFIGIFTGGNFPYEAKVHFDLERNLKCKKEVDGMMLKTDPKFAAIGTVLVP